MQATVGTAIAALSPTVTGTVSSYSVSPALPAGLSRIEPAAERAVRVGEDQRVSPAIELSLREVEVTTSVL